MKSGHDVDISLVRAALSQAVGNDPLDAIEDDDPLFERMSIDSLHLVAIVSTLEERFGIHVSAEDLVPDNFASISAIARLVARKSAGG
jgi:acyl carrier protein